MQRSYGGSAISQRVPGGVAHKMPIGAPRGLVYRDEPPV
jgi:hypothetical protein